jgi:hypothetical protein
MVVLTIRQNRLLAFDYRTSILLPGVFLVLTLLVFHPPESVSNWFFYAVGAAAACLSVAPLGFLFLHHHTPAWSFVIPAMLVLLALACLRLIRGSTRWAWGLSVLLYSSISFAIVPTSKTAAWESTGRDYEMSERVSRAVRIIENRLPQRAIPYLWVDGADNRLGNEFRAVASALIVQSESMLKFPNIDRTLPPGAHIFTLSAQRDVVGGASYLLARRQMPAHLVSQDRVEHAGVAYWITQFQVQPVSIESLRFGFILQPDPKLTLTSDSSGKDERKNLLRYKRLALPAPGIYQFELRGHAPAAIARFGALGSDGARWIEQSVTFLQEGPEPVMWFRLAVENNEPVDLAVEVTEPLSVTAQPSLSILRDIDTDHSVTAFEYLVPQSQTGLAIQNGGFEGGLSGWMGDNGNLYSSSDCHRGMCAEFAGLSGTESYVVHWRAVKLDIGGTYEFSAWLRSKTSGSQELSMRVWDPEISQSVARKAVKLTPAWTEYRVQFKNTSANWLAPQFVKPADSPGTFLLDEVAIRKVEHPE